MKKIIFGLSLALGLATASCGSNSDQSPQQQRSPKGQAPQTQSQGPQTQDPASPVSNQEEGKVVKIDDHSFKIEERVEDDGSSFLIFKLKRPLEELKTADLIILTSDRLKERSFNEREIYLQPKDEKGEMTLPSFPMNPTLPIKRVDREIHIPLSSAYLKKTSSDNNRWKAFEHGFGLSIVLIDNGKEGNPMTAVIFLPLP